VFSQVKESHLVATQHQGLVNSHDYWIVAMQFCVMKVLVIYHAHHIMSLMTVDECSKKSFVPQKLGFTFPFDSCYLNIWHHFFQC